MKDGEFGPVYDDASDGPQWKENNESRYKLLQTQLDIYARNNTSWSIWLWKGRSGFPIDLLGRRIVGVETVLIARYRIPGDGVCQRGDGLYETPQAFPGKEEGESGSRPGEYGLCEPDGRTSLPMLGGVTMIPSDTSSNLLRNGCWTLRLRWKRGTRVLGRERNISHVSFATFFSRYVRRHLSPVCSASGLFHVTWTPSTTWPRLRTQLIPQEELCNEYAEYFRGKSEAELDELAKSFSLENCLQRERLNAILSEDSKRAAAK